MNISDDTLQCCLPEYLGFQTRILAIHDVNGHPLHVTRECGLTVPTGVFVAIHVLPGRQAVMRSAGLASIIDLSHAPRVLALATSRCTTDSTIPLIVAS